MTTGEQAGQSPQTGSQITRLLGGFPAVAAIAVGLLYAVGALLKSAELSHAGLSVRDTLPLIPLQQLLDTGMALVFDNLVAILFFGAVFVGTYLLFWTSETRFGAKMSDLRRRHDTIGSELDGEGGLWEEHKKVKAELEALEESEGEDAEKRVAEIEKRAEAMRSRLDRVVAARLALESDLTAVEKSPRVRIFGLVNRLPAPVIILFLSASFLVGTPPFAVGIAVPFALGVLPTVQKRVRFFPHFVIFSVTWLLIVELAAAAISPSPLPSVQLLTTSGKTVQGSLIVTTGGTWYIATGGHAFVSVDSARVLSARVTSHGRHRARLVFQYLTH